MCMHMHIVISLVNTESSKAHWLSSDMSLFALLDHVALLILELGADMVSKRLHRRDHEATAVCV